MTLSHPVLEPVTGLQQPSQRICAVLIVVVYVISTLGIAFTSEPQSDESIYANPGYNLAFNGHMGTTIQDPESFSVPVKSIVERTYWQPPGYFVATSLWFRTIGFSFFRVRLFSMLFGLLAIAAWYCFAYRLQASTWTALAVAALVSVDYYFLNAAAHGRMEMMCVGLGSTAFAVYTSLRTTSLTKALFWSHSIAALAVFSHPASIVFIGGLVVLTIWLDREAFSLRRLPKLIFVVSIPYLLGAVAWGLYILQAPSEFVNQFRGVMQANAEAFNPPGLSSNVWIRNMQKELMFRYVGPFGLGRGVSWASRLKGGILGAYLFSIIGLLAATRFRSQRNKTVFPLLVLSAFILLAEVSPSKYYYYLPYTTVMMAASLGVLLGSVFEDGRLQRRFMFLAIFLIGGVQLAGTAYVVRQDPYHRKFLPAINATLKNSSEGSLVIGPQYFWLALWNQPRIFLADATVGFFNGKKPQLFVIDTAYQAFHDLDKDRNAPAYRHVEETIKNSRLVFRNETYRVYVPLSTTYP
jgi:4-amino-4-deoxy-L-arabinose transferase-like glycosyltransferase